MNQSTSNRNPTWEPYDKKMDDMAVEETTMEKKHPHKRASGKAWWVKDVKAQGDTKS